MSAFGDRLRGLGYASYEAYLASPHWQAFRQTYLTSGRPRECAVCSAGPVQLHHHNYANLGRESVEDVTPLCRTHHVAVHEWLKVNGKMVNATHKAVAELRRAIGTRPTPPRVRKKPTKKAKVAARYNDAEAAEWWALADRWEKAVAHLKLAGLPTKPYRVRRPHRYRPGFLVWLAERTAGAEAAVEANRAGIARAMTAQAQREREEASKRVQAEYQARLRAKRLARLPQVRAKNEEKWAAVGKAKPIADPYATNLWKRLVAERLRKTSTRLVDRRPHEEDR